MYLVEIAQSSDRNTLKMTSSLTIAFSGTKSVLQVKLFPDITLDDDQEYSCALLDLIIKDCKDASGNSSLNEIIGLGIICIDCDLISNSYINEVQKNRIHQFSTRAALVNPKAAILFEVPRHLNYFPLKNKNLRTIQISVVDEKGKPINLSGGNIICRIKIKRE